MVPGGSKANLAWVGPHLDLSPGAAVPGLVLADAQTNGGLLAAVPPEAVAGLLAALAAAGVVAAEIGEVLAGARPGRTAAGEITLYKSLGHAAQDLAAAAWLYQDATGKTL